MKSIKVEHREASIRMILKCGASHLVTGSDCYINLTKEEASTLIHKLKVALQDMELTKEHRQNADDGLCPTCKGSCINMDETPCDECGGKGICTSSMVSLPD